MRVVRCKFAKLFLLLAMSVVSAPHVGAFAESESDESAARSTLVGRTARFEQVVIDGPELKAKPITDESAVVLRIERVYPHGSGFRYDFEVYALEPGEYNLRDYLEASSGSGGTPPSDDPPADLPTDLRLHVESSLPDGRIEPHALTTARSPWLGGYRWLLAICAALWGIGLIMLIRWGRRRRTEEERAAMVPITTADRLRPLVRSALDGELAVEQRAVLERLLLTHWRERLNLTETDPSEGLATLREHSKAGELLRSLEDWLHRPDTPDPVDVERLLTPYLEPPTVEKSFDETRAEREAVTR